MRHIQIEIVCNEYQQEELIALLDDFRPAGFEQQDDKLIAYFSETDFDEEPVMEILSGYAYTLTHVEGKNWNEEWERNFSPVVVEDFVAIRAHFHRPVANVEHEIIITPKMSFGTGHHATTYLMMQQMRTIDFEGKKVFDFGTGTGILAILARKLGATKISAIDVDDWSIENAKENFERNGCADIEIDLSSQIPAEQFDIILANINRNVILNYMTQLIKALYHGAKILLSGLLTENEEEVKRFAEEQGLVLTERNERSGWISLLFVRTL